MKYHLVLIALFVLPSLCFAQAKPINPATPTAPYQIQPSQPAEPSHSPEGTFRPIPGGSPLSGIIRVPPNSPALPDYTSACSSGENQQCFNACMDAGPAAAGAPKRAELDDSDCTRQYKSGPTSTYMLSCQCWWTDYGPPGPCNMCSGF
jgi:hypothetical protein